MARARERAVVELELEGRRGLEGVEVEEEEGGRGFDMGRREKREMLDVGREKRGREGIPGNRLALRRVDRSRRIRSSSPLSFLPTTSTLTFSLSLLECPKTRNPLTCSVNSH